MWRYWQEFDGHCNVRENFKRDSSLKIRTNITVSVLKLNLHSLVYKFCSLLTGNFRSSTFNRVVQHMQVFLQKWLLARDVS